MHEILKEYIKRVTEIYEEVGKPEKCKKAVDAIRTRFRRNRNTHEVSKRCFTRVQRQQQAFHF